jgi:superfamily II DNA or RNA helicase
MPKPPSTTSAVPKGNLTLVDVYKTLRSEFGETGLSRGLAYAQRRAVKIVSAQADDNGEWELIAHVQGTEKLPYTTTLQLDMNARHVEVYSATCTCPVKFNCKHAAAVAMTWVERLPQEKGVLLDRSPEQITGDGTVVMPLNVHAETVETIAEPIVASMMRGERPRNPLDAVNETTRSDPPPATSVQTALPDALAMWLKQTYAAADTPTPKRAKKTDEDVMAFLLSVNGELAAAKAKRSFSNDEITLTGQLPSLSWAHQMRPVPAYIGAEDEPILRTMAAMIGPYQAVPAVMLHGASGTQLLRMVVSTGRVFVAPEGWTARGAVAATDKRRGAPEPETLRMQNPIAFGAAQPASLSWHTAKTGKTEYTRLAASVDDRSDFPLPLIAVEPPLVLNDATHELIPVSVMVSQGSLERLLSLPPIKPDDDIAWAYVADAIAALPDADAIPAVPALETTDAPLLLPTPKAILNFALIEFNHNEGWGSARRERSIVFPGVEFLLDYDGERVPFDPRGLDAAIQEEKQGTRVLSRRLRNVRAEQQWEMRMPRLLMHAAQVERALAFSQNSGVATKRTPRSLWALPTHDWSRDGATVLADAQMAGFTLEIEDGFPISLEDIPEPSLELSAGTETGWFRMALGVVVDGEHVDIAPALAKLIAIQKDPLMWLKEVESVPHVLLSVPSTDRVKKAMVVRLTGERVAAILKPVFEWFQGGGVGEISMLQAAMMPDLPNETVKYLGRDNPAWLAMRDAVQAGVELVPITPHSDFRATLRPYQLHGLAWLNHLHALRMGGVLADDMGLGKTVQTLALLQRLHASEREDDRPSLIIAPTSVVVNWSAEAKRFAPDLIIHRHHGADRSEDERDLTRADVVITSYPLLQRDEQLFAKIKWDIIVFDEAQVLKNPRAKTYLSAQMLKGRMKLALTGTPMENHLGELWSVYNLLLPGLLGDLDGFNRIFRFPIEQRADAGQMSKLKQRIRAFILRRHRDQVLGELPPKTEYTRWIELEAGQVDLYESLRTAIHDDIRKVIDKKGLKSSTIHILDALLKLRQVCCDPRLVKLPGAAEKIANAGSAKLDWIKTHVPELIEEGRSILIFSQFTSMLALISQSLNAAGIAHVELTGDTKDRETPVMQFQAGEVKVFLLSLKAGGVGLNLTAADTVIHYDPWWNPAVEAQATARAHRMGQNKPVFVTKLVARGTLEERMMALLDRKRELAAALLEGEGNALTGLTISDVEALLAPISSLAGEA